MKKRLKNLMILALIVISSFFLSFFECNNIHFVMNIPFIIYLASCNKFYPAFGFVGMLLASIVIDVNALPLVAIAIFVLEYLFLLGLKYIKISIKSRLCIAAVISSLCLGLIYYFSSLTTTVLTIAIVTLLTGLITNCLVDLQYDLKMKENISVTRKQLAFIGIFLNLIFSQIYFPFTSFYLGFALSFTLNFLLIKVDTITGIIACLIQSLLLANQNLMLGVYALIPLVFGIKAINKSSYSKLLSPILFAIISFYINSYVLLEEFSLTVILLLFINNDLVIDIHKYIIDPQDYELKLYQKSYYKCLNRNKKIQKVMELLEKQLASNPNMKLNNKKIILASMQYLSDKLKEEEDIKLKENILKEIRLNKFEVLSLKLACDYFYNYDIFLEIRNDKNISEKEFLFILEEHLQCKLKVDKIEYNNLLDVFSIRVINDEKLMLNFFTKQRSKDVISCGDSYINFNIKNKKYFLISDGMGHGTRANSESSAALLILKEFIELGMHPEGAIKLCNAVLLDKEKEMFNTLDLLEYDIFDNKIHIYKNGSGASYVRTNNCVEIIISENLPLGIIENINVKKQEININADFIVLTSDGIKKNIKNVIWEAKSNDPKSLIDKIFEYEGDIIEDDQTIVAISIRKNY